MIRTRTTAAAALATLLVLAASPPTAAQEVLLRAPAVTAIPTLSGWGAAVLALLLAGLARRRLGGGV